jgi:hypothetical protein
VNRFVIPFALWTGGLAVCRWLAGLAMHRRKLVPAILIIALGFVSFFWPTPYIDSEGNASVIIGAFLATVVYGLHGGLPATSAAFAWMALGLIVGALIGYLLVRSRGETSERPDPPETASRPTQTHVHAQTDTKTHEGLPDVASQERLLARESCPWCKRQGLTIVRRGLREKGVESLLVQCRGCGGMTTRRSVDSRTPFFRRVWVRLTTKTL